MKEGGGNSLHRDSSNQRAADVIVSSYNRSTDPSLDYCHRPNVQRRAPLTARSVSLIWPISPLPTNPQTLHVDPTRRAHMCAAFPSDELCSQRGVKRQYVLFIIRKLELTQSGTH